MGNFPRRLVDGGFKLSNRGRIRSIVAFYLSADEQGYQVWTFDVVNSLFPLFPISRSEGSNRADSSRGHRHIRSGAPEIGRGSELCGRFVGLRRITSGSAVGSLGTVPGSVKMRSMQQGSLLSSRFRHGGGVAIGEPEDAGPGPGHHA